MNLKAKIIFLLLLGMAFLPQLPAQLPPIAFQHLTTQDGLPTNKVSALYQDRSGFIWIGTLEGLVRYDGEEFVEIQDAPDGMLIEPFGRVNSIFEDSTGHIWAGSQSSGFLKLDPKTGKTTRYNHLQLPAAASDIDFDRAGMGVARPDGRVLLGTRAGLYELDARDSLVKVWPDMAREDEDYMPIVNRVQMGHGDVVWLGTRFGLSLFPPPGMETADLPAPPTIPNKVEAMLYEANRGLVWVGNDYGQVFRYDVQSGALDEIPLPRDPDLPYGNFVTAFSRDSKGRLWLGTYMNGLHRFDPASQAFLPYRASEFMVESRVNRQVNALLNDRQGNLWIGTGQGIYKFHPGREVFGSYPPTLEGKRLPSGDIRSMFRSRDGRRWLGSFSEGLLRVDGEMKIHRVEMEKPSPNWYPFQFTEDAEGNLWMGSHRGVFVLRDGKMEELKAFRPYFFKQVFDVEFDSSGLLWIAIPSPNLYAYDPETGQVESYPLPYFDEFRGGCRFSALEMGDDSTLWVGTAECGLWTFDLKEKRFVEEHIQGEAALEEQRLPAVEKLKIEGGESYFALDARGFGRINGGAQAFFTATEGLPSNHVVGFLQHGEKLWVFTKNGLAEYDPESNRFRHTGWESGLREADFGGQPIQDPATGRILAFTDNYLIDFHPDSLTPPPLPPPVKLISVELFGKPLPPDSFSAPDIPLHVPYHSNSFSVRFAALDYLRPGAIEYAYHLEGLHNDWLPNGNSRMARFNKLPGGDYVLHVRARSGSGNWNAGAALLRIHVGTPFWKTWWFIALLIAAGIGLAYGLYRIRLQRILAIVDIRSRISRNLHDEIGSSLTSISILSQVLLVKQGDQDPDSADLLQKISAHASQSMSSMDDIIWTINPLNDQPGHLLVRLRQIAADILEPAGISIRLDFDEALQDLPFNVDQRWNITMVFKEALNNAVKYADCEVLEASFLKQGKKLVLQVADNGKGFDPQQPTQRNGLSNMRQRAKALKGSLDIQSELGKGTRIVLTIPK